LNLLKTNNKQRTTNFIVFPRTCNPHNSYLLFLSAIMYFVSFLTGRLADRKAGRPSNHILYNTVFLFAYFIFLISTIIFFGSINSSATLFAAAKEQEITEENILSKISLATQWLTEQQRPDGSWPIVTQDKRSSVVATGLFGLGTFNQTTLSSPNMKNSLSFLLAHQHNEGYWKATSSFNWNKVEATTAALYGLIRCRCGVGLIKTIVLLFGLPADTLLLSPDI